MSYALDAVAANVTGAWGFRKLLTAYAGNAGRLRRVASATESNIGFAGDALDRYSAQTFHNNGITNTAWMTVYDQSGHGRNMTNGTYEVLAYSQQYQAGAYLGDSLAALHQNSSTLTCAVGSPVHTTLLGGGIGTILLVVQSWAGGAIQNLFSDNGGWFGLQFLNGGAASNLAYTARAWHYNSIGGGTLANSGTVATARFHTHCIAWRAKSNAIDVCVDGIWGTPTASAPTGGSGNNFSVGSATLTGLTGECATLNTALTDEQVAAWGVEASAYWRGRWPVASSGGGGLIRHPGMNGGFNA
jgi:hypothetical protein